MVWLKTQIRRWILAVAIALTLIGQLLVVPPALATGVYAIPNLAADGTPWLVDEADVISRSTEGRVTQALKDLANTTGHQLRMVVIHRLDYGETTGSFGEQLLEKWFPNPEDRADQGVLVLDNVTNEASLKTGSTLQTVLSDQLAQSITAETMFVPLRDGSKYNQALSDATDRVVAVLSGQPDPGPPSLEQQTQARATFTKAEETDDKSATVVVVVLLLLATVIPMVTYYWYVR